MANSNWKYQPEPTEDLKSKRIRQIKKNMGVVVANAGYKFANGEFSRGEQARLKEAVEALQNQYDYSNDAIKKLFDIREEYHNMYLIMGLCELFNVDISAVLSYSDIDIENAVYTDKTENAKFSVFNDVHYMGTYHGYTVSSNISSSEIIHFTLSIKKMPNGEVLAEYIHDNKKGTIKTMFGTPKHIKKSDVIEIPLRNEYGNFRYLYFKYSNYESSSMYYRKGIAVTSSTPDQKPFVQNFVLFNRELSQEAVEKYVKGLLKLATSTFRIKKSKFQELVQQDKELASFVDEYNSFIKEETDYVYSIKEHALLSFLEDEDRDCRINAYYKLTALKAYSLEPYTIEYNAELSEAHFARDLTEHFGIDA